jgi:hypothetical protein
MNTPPELLVEIANVHGIYLSAAARRFPPSRQGRQVTLGCMVRWILDGVRGPDGKRVRLEASRLAGKWITTPQAIVRFLEAQSPKIGNPGTEAPRSARARQRAADQAAAALSRLGM